MRRIVKIGFGVALLGALLVGCSQTDDTNYDQRADIIEYLEEDHSPTLLSESDAAESLDDESPFYTMGGYAIFRYIENYYNVNRESMAQIQKGSTISITYTLYNFEDYTTPSELTILSSNDADQIALLEQLDGGLNTTYWSTDPLSLKVGDGTLLSSVEDMLVGCREGDVVEFYMTLDEAYGSSIIGLSVADAPLALFCEILTVN